MTASFTREVSVLSDDTELEFLQAVQDLSPEKRQKIKLFMKMVAEGDECAKNLLWRTESGDMAAEDIFTAIDHCLKARH
jgi:hypothetical protein